MKKLPIFILLLLTVPWSLSSIAAEDEPVTKTLVWPDGTRYVGGVVDGKRSGKGTIFWQDGTRFVGQFENDMRNGPGTMILPDGTVYTGFFRDDELVDTESTIAARTEEETVELEDDAVAELTETSMPMEADSIGDTDRTETIAAVTEEPPEEVVEVPPFEVAQIDTPDPEPEPEPEPEVVEPEPVVEEPVEEVALADNYLEETLEETPEENVEPVTEEPVDEEVDEPDYEQDIAYVDDDYTDDYEIEDPYIPGDVTSITDAVKDELIETVDLWKNAWSDQNVTQYLAYYSEDFAVPSRGQSRRTWEALRRTRLTRPRYINLDVTYQRFEFVETNVIDVFFRQTYRSNTYSDLTDKVLRMRKEGNDWKILIERSR